MRIQIHSTKQISLIAENDAERAIVKDWNYLHEVRQVSAEADSRGVFAVCISFSPQEHI